MEYNHSQYVIEAIKQNVIPQVRTYTRYGTGSVVMFDYAESPFETFQLEIGFAELKVPYRQAHKARSCACSLCLTE